MTHFSGANYLPNGWVELKRKWWGKKFTDHFPLKTVFYPTPPPLKCKKKHVHLNVYSYSEIKGNETQKLGKYLISFAEDVVAYR